MRSSKPILILLILTFAWYKAWPQSNNIFTFPIPYYQDAWAIHFDQTYDGGYLITGYTGIEYNYDILIIRTDSNYDRLWTRKINVGNNEQGEFIQTTSDSGFIVAATISIPSDPVNSGPYLLKFDRHGTLQWKFNYGDTLLSACAAIVRETTDKGFAFLLGDAEGNKSHLVKIDRHGNKQWEKKYYIEGSTNLQNLILTNKGGFLLLGGSGRLSSQMLLISADSNGIILSERKYGNSNNRGAVWDAVQLSDGGFVVICDYSNELMLLRVDERCDSLWTNTVDYYSSRNYGIIKADLGGYYIASDDYLLKIDTLGNYQNRIYIDLAIENGTPIPLVEKKPGTVTVINNGFNKDSTSYTRTIYACELTNDTRIIPFLSNYDVASKLEFIINPNPSSSYINFIYNSPVVDNHQIMIYDCAGRLCGRFKCHKNNAPTSQIRYDVSRFTPGEYYLVLSEDRKFSAQKFTIFR